MNVTGLAVTTRDRDPEPAWTSSTRNRLPGARSAGACHATSSPVAVARMAAPVTGAIAAGIVNVVRTGDASPPAPCAMTEMRMTAPGRMPGNDAVVAVVSTRLVVPPAVASTVNPVSPAPVRQDTTRDPLAAAAASVVTGAAGVVDGVGVGRMGSGSPEDVAVGVGDGVGVSSADAGPRRPRGRASQRAGTRTRTRRVGTCVPLRDRQRADSRA